MGYHKYGQLSQHFHRKEFACKCGCGFNTVDAELVYLLEFIRDNTKTRGVIVTSGCRCPEHNNRVGGSPNSQHLKGKAADFRVRGVDSDEVANIIDLFWGDRYGVGRYDSWTHLDVRSTKSRWDLRS